MRDRRERIVNQIEDRTALGDRVTAALQTVPRHAFVPPDRRTSAHDDRPLPIGAGQTISAPHMMAMMTDALDTAAGTTVLEIGTGCGYHAAVTAELVGASTMYSVEYHAALADRARKTLAATGYDAVMTRVGDGRNGWPAHVPYDRVYLTCAAEAFPPALVEQVRPGGILLGPIGRRRQQLVRAQVRADGTLDRTELGAVRFVRLQ
ncbi:MAG: protein-L-isoaspartate(D-aspartate) O-methyltransferase [halophilic archaeon J07HX5]|nr:MAG: protein-L-isoaspartate(D-aspartate) O-methyltransferase [halophilic archaeon J07HX5]